MSYETLFRASWFLQNEMRIYLFICLVYELEIIQIFYDNVIFWLQNLEFFTFVQMLMHGLSIRHRFNILNLLYPLPCLC